jgi:small subunit ribosomal protein S2
MPKPYLQSRALHFQTTEEPGGFVPLVNVQELIDAGVHYGHQTSRWNPKMKPYIHGRRHNIHIIDLQETIRGLIQATHFVRRLASTGAEILFLGTKKQIRAVVESEAARCGMPSVTERWIGGTLTNFPVVRERLARLEQIEGMETDGSLERYKKKDQSTLRREMRKIRRNLEGIRQLHGLPGAIVVVDPRREDICIREAARMNVPVVCILDTDCNPELADIVIPANDDAMSSVQLLLARIADAILEGRQSLDEATLIQAQKSAQEDLRTRDPCGRRGGPGGPGDRRGGGRPGGRRDGPGGAGAGRLGRRPGRGGEQHADSVSFGVPSGEEAPAGATPPPAGGEGSTPSTPSGDSPAEQAPGTNE